MRDSDAEPGHRSESSSDERHPAGEVPAGRQPGGERGSGRPTGVPGDARPTAEGRPVEVRGAIPARRPSSEQPTEGATDRGETPTTEHDPGQDL